MYNVLVRLVANKALAEELLQDAFVKAFTRIDQYDGKYSFGAWLKRIVINTGISELRKRKTDFVAFDPIKHDIAEEAEEIPGLKPEHLQRAIQNLPDGTRTVFTLYQVEGYKHREIAELLNVSESASKVQYMRARTQLRESLKPEYYAG